MNREALPEGWVLVRTTDTFDAATVPAGLLRAHRVAEGVWGRLVVHAGQLDFVFEDQPAEPIAVGAGGTLVIPPGRPHHLVIDGSVRFAVEFYSARMPSNCPTTGPAIWGRVRVSRRSPDT